MDRGKSDESDKGGAPFSAGAVRRAGVRDRLIRNNGEREKIGGEYDRRPGGEKRDHCSCGGDHYAPPGSEDDPGDRWTGF